MEVGGTARGDGRAGEPSDATNGVPSQYDHVFLPRSQRLGRLPRLVVQAVRLVWSAGRREFVVTTLLQVVQGIGLTAQLVLGKRVLDALLPADAGSGAFSDVLPELGLLVALTVVLSFAAAVLAEQSRVLGELVARDATDRVLDVAQSIELEAFESPTFFDRLQRAQMGGLTRPLQMVSGLGTLATSVVSVLGISVALAAIQPALVPFLLLGYAPLWYASTRNSKALFRFMLDLTQDDRQRGYLHRVLSGRDEAKEIRSLALGPMLRRRYDRLYDERIAKLRQVARRRMVRSLAAAFGTSGLTVVALGVLAYMYTSDRMSLASIGIAVAGLLQVGAMLRNLAVGAGALYESALFMEDYESFLQADAAPRATPSSRTVPDTLPPFDRLETDGLGFTYPGSNVPALVDVTLEIAAGEVVALVGENGSGKTTLAKLLAHLYRPTAGRILWDGRDSNELDPELVRRSIAVLFQDFVRYRLPARENVGAGRHESIDDLERVRDAARHAGADGFLAELPYGYDTTLAKEFVGGVDLSIGQWQRVALARAFFRDAPFVILDEPTAALDPRAEDALFSSIRSLFASRSVLLISHRFSSVRTADRIYVLRAGRIIERGTHEDLMAVGGLYAELFTLQAAAYLPPGGRTSPSSVPRVGSARKPRRVPLRARPERIQ